LGDSRLYQVRWGNIEKITDGHTAVMELVRAGAVKEEDAKGHPWAHVLSRVVGKGDVEVPSAEIQLEAGDRFLICSDGFSDSLTSTDWITDIVAKSADESASELVSRAVELDGSDNATAVVVVVGAEGARVERRSLWQRFLDMLTDDGV
jgi:serine/threonine protein phosphatase PrpC